MEDADGGSGEINENEDEDSHEEDYGAGGAGLGNSGIGIGSRRCHREKVPPVLRLTSVQLVAMAGGAAAVESAMEHHPNSSSIAEHGRCALYNLVLLSSAAQARVLASVQGLKEWAEDRALHGGAGGAGNASHGRPI